MRKDDKRRIAYEILIFLATLLVLFLVLRMWPIVFLFILGIFVAALRMLFLSTKKVEIIEPAAPMPAEAAPPETERDLLGHAYAIIQRRITETVTAEHANARWVWETPNAQESISEGEPVSIVLNGAGGYRKARVLIRDLQYQGLEYEGAGASPVPQAVEAEANAYLPSEGEQPKENKQADAKVNYECLAFEWIDDNLLSLMERCKEALANGDDHLLIPAADLPTNESWPDIQKQLLGNGFTLAMETDEGIKVNLPQ